MCGIAGIFGNFGNNLNKKKIQILKKEMSIRGPDNFGKIFFDVKNGKKINFFHSRLKIIDPDLKSNQPMKDEQGILIFNGMIYNYIEIKKKLKKKKILFKTESDTEVLLKFLNFYGPKKLHLLDGMWSFAYYNFKNKSLIISRDKFGEKPLYYHHDKNNFYFGSNLNYILTLCSSSFKINYKKIFLYLRYSFKSLFIDNETFFKNINSLDPGSYIILEKNKNLKIKKFWSLKDIKEKKFSYQKHLKIIKKEINHILKTRLRSNFPVACSLSGGVDSSGIVSFINKKLNKKIPCFSVKAKEKNFNEKENILKVVNENKLNHSFIKIKKDNNQNLKELKLFIKKTSSILPTTTWFVFNNICKNVKKKHKVILSGVGADEIFGGYWIHQLHYLHSIRKRSFFKKKYHEWESFSKPLIRSKELKDYKNYKKNDKIFLEFSALNKYFKKEEVISSIRYERNNNLDHFKQALVRDLMRMSLPSQIYPLDNVSMYNGLENRSPYLSGDLLKIIFQVPTKYFIQNGYNKYILRDILKNIIPKQIVNDRNKIGFFMGIDYIFSTKSKVFKNIIFSNSIINKLINKNEVLKLILKENKNNQESHFLFGLLNVVLFLKEFDKQY